MSSPLIAAFTIAPRVVSLSLELRGEAGKIISYVQVVGNSAYGSVPGEEAGKLLHRNTHLKRTHLKLHGLYVWLWGSMGCSGLVLPQLHFQPDPKSGLVQ